MRTLITGAAGFLGSHLADRLVADGHEVVGLDDFSSGRWENVTHLVGGDRFHLIKADVVEPVQVKGPFERIFHLASPVSGHLERPIETLRTAAEGTRRLLDLAADGRAVFVLASSSEVYGAPAVHPQVETDPGRVSPVVPRASYSEAKRFAEALASAYQRARGVPVRIARIFNTYGPRMRPDDKRVIPTFITQALSGRPLPVFGTGRQTRSFCYVSDMVEALVRLAETDLAGPVNLGNPDEVAVVDLAREILELSGSSSSLTASPLPADDPPRRRPDVTRALRLLGWRPVVSRRDGLERTIAHFRDEEKVE
ncbi:MAG: GDP-mannose 4,6-dehydratase [Planctomycetes bacterium]|nr:GDP-mannose 4,6-dehydratase [Planctomycetota bacterium]